MLKTAYVWAKVDRPAFLEPPPYAMRQRPRRVPRWTLSHPGLTLVELLVLILIIALGIAILLPAVTRGHHHGHNRGIKDATQVRGIHQGLVLWAQNNKDRYPMPGEFDTANATIDAPAETKNTTANILSILIFNNFFSPELCVSPLETNPSIGIEDAYAFETPPQAADPRKAMWDPAFIADFSRPGVPGNKPPAHVSYGHLRPADARLEQWRTTGFDPNLAVIGNRGPEVSGVTYAKKGEPKAQLVNPGSNTLRIHGSRDTWEGNIAYNDNSVNFETSPAPEAKTYENAAKAMRRDVLFFDEPDDPRSLNNFLGVYTTSGTTSAEFKAIWD